MLKLPPPFLPVSARAGVLAETITLRLHPFANDLQQLRPALSLAEAQLSEIDHVPTMKMRRTLVDLLTPDVGEDSICIERIAANESAHLGDCVCLCVLVVVIKREPLPVDLGA